MSKTLILGGPYGTEKERRGFTGDSASIFSSSGNKITGDIANDYIKNGSTLMASNTFWVRNALNNNRDGSTEYQRSLQAEWYRLVQTINNLSTEVATQIRTCIALGPHGDCYALRPNTTAAEYQEFHDNQIGYAKDLNTLHPDFILFETVNSATEALGQALALQQQNFPGVISFVTNAEGKLLSGENVHDAIREIDQASNNHPLGYMLNCCPPQGLEKSILDCNERTTRPRIIGAYPNAATTNIADLDGSEGVVGVKDPKATAKMINDLSRKYNLRIVGGCCGFDPESIKAITEESRR